MSAYYNENDPAMAAWLAELMARGLIAKGHIDTRSITEVQPSDLHGFAQCHFFAGIGGWSAALRLAGWPDDRPVWTGSCPCQPFSAAGKGKGTDDERHLWPVFRDLIRQCRPDIIFGEQVASAAVVGPSTAKAQRDFSEALRQCWLDGVCADLETAHYACGATDLPAACVGAPDIRQRLYWLANAAVIRCDEREHGREVAFTAAAESQYEPIIRAHGLGCGGSACGMANSMQSGWAEGRPESGNRSAAGSGGAGGLGEPNGAGWLAGRTASTPTRHGSSSEPAGNVRFWSDCRIVHCADNKARRIPTQPALFPLADGIPYKLARRGSILPALLKGAGNAIVPPLAAEFIAACNDVLADPNTHRAPAVTGV